MKIIVNVKPLAVVLSLLLGYSVAAQQKIKEYQRLDVGDTLPDHEFTELINFKSSKIKFSDLKGKAIILDLWNTGCTQCILSMPHMMDVQKRYQDKLQIITINPWEKKEVVAAFFEKRKKEG